MADNRKVLGQFGETVALSYLKTNGYKIVETNYRTRTAEIDIIAKDADTLCFIEVKTRKSLTKGLPRESVTHTKQQKIFTGARTYLQKTRQLYSKSRFDVVEVLKNNEDFVINHIKHAFQVE